MSDNRGERQAHVRRTGPRGAAYWARENERTATGVKRSSAENGRSTPVDGEHSAKRPRTDVPASLSTAAIDIAAGRGGSQSASATIRDLKAQQVEAKLDLAAALDQVTQIKQVLVEVTNQLVDAKAEQFHDTMTREEIVTMLYDGMPSWIAQEVFPVHAPVTDDRAAAFDSASAVATERAPLEYFLEGPVADEHLAYHQAAAPSSTNGPALANEDLGQLPGVNYRRSLNAILWQTTEKYTLPAPVGRFGHPFCKGWLWEDFEAKRLFDRGRRDYIAPTSSDFSRLAREAVRIPFACRSAAQRQVVSVGLTQRVLPVPGTPAEPNVLQFCKENPALLPYAIRRQYTCDHEKAIVYSEWDAVDLGVYIALKMAAPAKAASSEAQRHQHAQWLTALQYTLYWAGSDDASWWSGTVPEEYPDGPRPYEGALGDYSSIFEHLQRCGLPYETLLEGPHGYAYNDVQRIARCEARKTELTGEYERTLPHGERPNQRSLRDYISQRMLYERVPGGNAVVRIKLTNRKVQCLLEQAEKVVQYTTY